MSNIFKYLRGDRTIWILVILMLMISLLVVFTSISSLAVRSHSLGYHIIKHMFLLLGGVIILFVTHLIPYKYFSKISVFLYYISIPLLIITLFVGQNLNSAYRSIDLMGISVQTSDLAKIALIMYLARELSHNQDRINDFKNFILPLSAKVMVICGLILPADLSTAALLFVVAASLMFIARVRFIHLIAVVLLSVFLLGVSMVVLSQFTDKVRIDTWVNRVERFVKPSQEAEYSEKDFQAIQSKIAVASGDIYGKGPGHSTQRNILPHPYSDYIYAIITEEYGLFGGIVVLFIYLILLYRAELIVRRSPTHFGAFLAIGLSMSLVFQAFINMGVCVGIFPVTGQPLPIISMGGSSILASCFAIGVILSVSRNLVRKNEVAT